MTTGEVFGELVAHMTHGVMFHSQMEDYFTFLGLPDYACAQREHMLAEMKRMACAKTRYITVHDQLVPDVSVKDPAVIPDSWHRYTRQEVDQKSKRMAVRDGIARWIEWETAAHKTYCDARKTLMENGDVSDALWLCDIITDVCSELTDAKQLQLDLAATDYEMGAILTHL